MHLRLTLKALSLSELSALGLDGFHLLLLVAHLVLESTRTNSTLNALVRTVHWAALVTIVVAGIRARGDAQRAVTLQTKYKRQSRTMQGRINSPGILLRRRGCCDPAHYCVAHSLVHQRQCPETWRLNRVRATGR